MKLVKRKNGFTLIELLIVVTIIGILSAVILSVLNTNEPRNKAYDAVNISDTAKVVDAISVYLASEGEAPQETTVDNNPINDSNGLERYLTKWPTDMLYVSAGIQTFCVSTPMQATTGGHIKYVFDPAISNTCMGRVLRDCTEACTTSSSSFTSCVVVSDGAVCP